MLELEEVDEDKPTDLDRTHIDRAINKIISNLNFRMCCQDFSRDASMSGGRITRDWFVMQAL
jgi:hypothetical protein